jgi:RES domain-containing protein
VIACYRLSARRYPSKSGLGAALVGGRWNPVGIQAIYAAATPSLAALEVLVHFAVLPRDYVLTEVQIPDGIDIETLETKDLPAGWRAPSPQAKTQEFGRRWAAN